MILAIDGYEANEVQRVGIGRYAFELIDHIARLKPDVFSEVRVYIPGARGSHMPNPGSHWHYRTVFPRRGWTLLGFPLALSTDSPRADVVFTPTHYVPRWITIPRVMAIMDVSYLMYPEMFRGRDLVKLTNWTAYSARHAASIITISEFSKRAIIEAYHMDPKRVHVVYPALPDEIIHMPMGEYAGTQTLPKRYILSVGTLQPRKNFRRLIEAYSQLKDTSTHLVIVGKKGWLYDDILSSPKDFGVDDRVHFMDFVSDADLAYMYEHAELFVLPSLYEGFGLPVLEAMAHGVPVVVSKTSSLPEIAGEAGSYVDPDSVVSIRDGIAAALSENGIEKAKRIKLGKLRVKEFTWEKAADQVMKVLESAAKGVTSV